MHYMGNRPQLCAALASLQQAIDGSAELSIPISRAVLWTLQHRYQDPREWDHDPLYLFAAYMSFERVIPGKIFRSPLLIPELYSSLQHVFRLAILHKALDGYDGQEVKAAMAIPLIDDLLGDGGRDLDQVIEYGKDDETEGNLLQWICPGRSTPFSTLKRTGLVIINFAKGVQAISSYNWADDGSLSLTFTKGSGFTVALPDIIKANKGILSHLHSLVQQCFGNTPSEWMPHSDVDTPPFDPSSIYRDIYYDEPNNQQPGYSFLQHPKNKYGSEYRTMLWDHIRLHHRQHLFYDHQPHLIDPEKGRKWLMLAYDYADHFGIDMQVDGGPPSRTPDLEGMRWQESPGNRRHIFIGNNQLYWVFYRDEKSFTITQRDKVTPKFMSKPLTDIGLIFIILIHPTAMSVLIPHRFQHIFFFTKFIFWQVYSPADEPDPGCQTPKIVHVAHTQAISGRGPFPVGVEKGHEKYGTRHWYPRVSPNYQFFPAKGTLFPR